MLKMSDTLVKKMQVSHVYNDFGMIFAERERERERATRVSYSKFFIYTSRTCIRLRFFCLCTIVLSIVYIVYCLINTYIPMA